MGGSYSISTHASHGMTLGRMKMVGQYIKAAKDSGLVFYLEVEEGMKGKPLANAITTALTTNASGRAYEIVDEASEDGEHPLYQYPWAFLTSARGGISPI